MTICARSFLARLPLPVCLVAAAVLSGCIGEGYPELVDVPARPEASQSAEEQEAIREALRRQRTGLPERDPSAEGTGDAPD